MVRLLQDAVRRPTVIASAAVPSITVSETEMTRYDPKSGISGSSFANNTASITA
jgi:hypothetical protein